MKQKDKQIYLDRIIIPCSNEQDNMVFEDKIGRSLALLSIPEIKRIWRKNLVERR
jgi:hypothetical protein